MAGVGRKDSSELDPRRRAAQRYMDSANAELDRKQAEQPAHERPAEMQAGGGLLADLFPSVSAATCAHAILLSVVLTLAALAVVWCYAVLDTSFVAGRVVTLPTGVLTFVALSYGSAFYLGIVETTSMGRTTPEHALRGSWIDWFWTLPSTLGMVAAAAGIGWLASLFFEDAHWVVIGVTAMLVYPLLQLSVLENGSALAPFSLGVLRTLVTRPLAWLLFYVEAALIAFLIVVLAMAVWRDPPYTTMLVMGPVTTIAVLIYGLLLGTLARWITIKGR